MNTIGMKQAASADLYGIAGLGLGSEFPTGFAMYVSGESQSPATDLAWSSARPRAAGSVGKGSDDGAFAERDAKPLKGIDRVKSSQAACTREPELDPSSAGSAGSAIGLAEAQRRAS